MQISGRFRQFKKKKMFLFLRLPSLISFLSFIDTWVKQINKIWKGRENHLSPYKTTSDLYIYTLYLETKEPVLPRIEQFSKAVLS